MSKGFRKVVLCSTDDHPKDNNKVKGWVESNGGTYTRELTPSTTHLLTSERAWKQYTPLVKAARRMKTIKIVSWEWLEDSLLFNKRRPLPTERYNLDIRHLQKRKKESARNALREKYRMSVLEGRGEYDVGLSPDPRDGVRDRSKGTGGGKEAKIQEAGKSDASVPFAELLTLAGDAYDMACSKMDAKMKAAGYHIYIDPLHFPYDITLMRSDIHRKLLSKHQIKVRLAPFLPSFDVDCASSSSHDSPMSTHACTLLPCPLRLYYFPQASPYSHSAVLSTRLPRQSQRLSLRTHIPNPWAMSLQLYRSNTFPPTYSARSIFLDAEGKIHVERIAPTGSEFPFAKECFMKFFKLRTGVEWESRAKAVQLPLAEGRGCRPDEEEALERKRALSHDGAGGFAYVPGPKDFWIGSDGSGFGRRGSGGSGSGGAADGRPFVTMVVTEAAVEGVEVRPMTPVRGW